MEKENPKVFISYSHDSSEQQDKVLQLSNKLRSEGIDCSLDQYEDSPPEGWPKWMDRQVKNSNLFLNLFKRQLFTTLTIQMSMKNFIGDLGVSRLQNLNLVNSENFL